MEAPASMFRYLCKKIETEKSELNLILKKKQENGKEILTTLNYLT